MADLQEDASVKITRKTDDQYAEEKTKAHSPVFSRSILKQNTLGHCLCKEFSFSRNHREYQLQK